MIIFDQLGNVLNKFGCSKHLEFPNGVVVNDRQEIFISDNRAHCVKVFDYEGNFLRQIGGEGRDKIWQTKRKRKIKFEQSKSPHFLKIDTKSTQESRTTRSGLASTGRGRSRLRTTTTTSTSPSSPRMASSYPHSRAR